MMSATGRACRAWRLNPAGGLLRRSAARLSECRRRFLKSTSTTRTTCCGRPREDVTRMLRGKLLPWNLVASHGAQFR